MTLDEFKTIYAENPSADEVMEEINRLYESERTLTESFATADSERNRLQKELDDANKRYRERLRYRERFFSGPGQNKDNNTGDPFAQFFKDKE